MIVQHYIELLRYYRIQLIAFVIFTTMIFAAISTIKLLNSPIYTASAAVSVVPSEAEMTFSLAAGANRREAGRALTQTYMEYVKSRPVVLAAIEKVSVGEGEVEAVMDSSPWDPYITKIKEFKKTVRRWMHILNYGSYKEVPAEDSKVNKILDAIEVKNITNTHILNIAVNLSDPNMAASLANTLAEVFVEQMSNDLNEDAQKLEGHIQRRINSLNSELAAIQAKRTRQKKRFGVVNEDTSDLSQIDILQQQLAELNSRLLSIKLSRSASTKLHLIEPAIPPVYPSSPQVLRNTLLGFLAGIILSLVMIVVRDAINNKIVTNSDLNRVVGVRGIGIFKRKWVQKKKWRALLKLGIALERRLAIHGDFDRSFEPKVEFIQDDKAQLITPKEYLSIAQEKENVEPEKQLKVVNSDANNGINPTIQVTGMTSMSNVCWATICLAAALASQGRKVVCKLSDDFINTNKDLSRFEEWKRGSIKFFDRTDDDIPNSDFTIECIGPMTTDLDLTQSIRTCQTLVCVLPINKVQEDMVEALQNRTSKNNCSNISYLIMAK